MGIKRQRTDRILLWLSVGGFLMMSASFVLMPLEGMKILPGVLFWLGMLLGIVLQAVLEARRRAFFRAYGVRRQNMQKPHNGACSFGSNRAASVADGAMIISFVGLVLALVLNRGYGFECYVLIAATVFSFCMHCVLNGRNYFHANNQRKVRQVLEEKKAKSTEKGEGEP